MSFGNTIGTAENGVEITATDYVIATYLVEDRPDQLKKRADSIAVGLTVGSWTDLPLTKQASVQRHCGAVFDVDVLEVLADGLCRAHLSIGYPVINFTPSIAALLTTVFGKLSMDGKIRLVKLELPESYINQFSGPKYGVEGLRGRLQVHGRPFIMSIFKSCIGNNLDELTDHFIEQARSGVDLVKDDEIFFTEAYATPEERVGAYAAAAQRVAAETGRNVAYAVNLTGNVCDLVDRAKRLADLGAGALLFNTVAYGYDLLLEIASNSSVNIPVMVHPAVSGALYGSAEYGISASIVLGQLMRLAGADIVIYPSPYGSVTLPREEGLALVSELRCETGLRPCLPAPSAGIHPGMVPTLLRDLGQDFIVNAGGSIHGHPGGATAGGKAFVAAVEAAVRQVPLEQAAADSPELAAALEKWGGIRR